MVTAKRGSARDQRLVFKCWLAALIVSAIFASCLDGHTTKVTTRFGQVKGLWGRSSRGRLVAHYLGIPYAEPPVGGLRFRSPQPWNRTWGDVYEATKNSPMCTQLDEAGDTVGSEDCLYLNVFLPMISEERVGNSGLPVLVYVHGGKFSTGSSDSRQLPPDYLMDQDVILVTINHRLNVLGFLSTASRASPGNYGVKDVLMGLRWLHENIGSFNGNRDAVTLWGHSSGAAVVHALALSNKTEGLFNRYILQSGSALCPWAMGTSYWMRRIALQTAWLLDCLPERQKEHGVTDGHAEGSTTPVQPEVTAGGGEKYLELEEYDEQQEEEMMRCLRNVEAPKIGKVMSYYTSTLWKGNPCCIFGPTIEAEAEDAILTVHPLVAIKNRLFRDIPFIIGVVENEGLIKTADLITSAATKDELINNLETYLPYVLEYYQLISNSTAFVDAIVDFYFAGNVSSTLGQNITEAVSDSVFLWPAYQTIKYQSELMNSSTYFYLFSYDGTFTSTFSSGLPNHYGISHADDLNYLIPLLNKQHKDQMLHNTENDVTMINIMTEMWASFAAEGVPKAWRVPAWPNYKDTNEFLRFGVDRHPEVVIESQFFPERMDFWDELTANLSLNTIEPQTIIQPLIRDEAASNSATLDKHNQISPFLLISLALCCPLLKAIYL